MQPTAFDHSTLSADPLSDALNCPIVTVIRHLSPTPSAQHRSHPAVPLGHTFMQSFMHSSDIPRITARTSPAGMCSTLVQRAPRAGPSCVRTHSKESRMARRPSAAAVAAAADAADAADAAPATPQEYVYSFDPEDPVGDFEPLPFEDEQEEDTDTEEPS